MRFYLLLNELMNFKQSFSHIITLKLFNIIIICVETGITLEYYNTKNMKNNHAIVLVGNVKQICIN